MTPGATLTLGDRADYNTRFCGAFNPRVGLVGRPADGTTLKVLYGTAFQNPRRVSAGFSVLIR